MCCPRPSKCIKRNPLDSAMICMREMRQYPKACSRLRIKRCRRGQNLRGIVEAACAGSAPTARCVASAIC